MLIYKIIICLPWIIFILNQNIKLKYQLNIHSEELGCTHYPYYYYKLSLLIKPIKLAQWNPDKEQFALTQLYTVFNGLFIMLSNKLNHAWCKGIITKSKSHHSLGQYLSFEQKCLYCKQILC